MNRYFFFIGLLILFTSPAAQAEDKPKTIVFFGDSITAGYGLEKELAYPALIQNKIDTENLPYKVINAGISGDTTSSGLNRLDWVLKKPVDIFVLALGGNDGLRGVPLDTTKDNLEKIIDKVTKTYPKALVVLAGFKMPPNYGYKYTREFENVYKKLAEQKDVEFIPYLLKGVGGNPKLNLPDQIHPTAEGQQKIATTVWKKLEDFLD